MADQNWNKGNYFDTSSSPNKGLAVARMAAHITYLSKKSFRRQIWQKTSRKK